MTTWDTTSARLLREWLDRPDCVQREVTVEEARERCPVLRTDLLRLAAVDATACDIDVMALHGGYVRGLRRRGGTVHTNASLVRVDRGNNVWQVHCADGSTWTADVLVNAAGAWGDDVAARCGVSGHGLSPCRRTVVIARTSGEIDRRWPAVVDAAEAWYFKPEGATLLLSPGDETPVPPGDVQPDPVDIALALERVNAVTSLDLRSVASSWAGLRTFAPDRCPVVGAHPEEPSLFCFLGQGGYGIQMAPALARVGAELLRTGTAPQTEGWTPDDLAPARFNRTRAGSSEG